MPHARLSARPLLDTDADAALFIPLGSSLADLIAATDRGYSVLLHGPRGAGRSTLLRALIRRRRLAPPNHGGHPTGPLVFVQAAPATTPGEALQACRAALADTLDTTTHADAEVSGPRSVAAELDALRADVAGLNPTFLLDNLDPHIAHRLFGAGRDDLWELDASFVLTVTDDDLPIVLAPPADAYFEVRIGIPAPTLAEARDLLERRLGRAVTLSDAPATPRAAVDAARADPDDPASAVAARSARLAQAAALGPSALVIAQVMDEFGAISPSDSAVRDRLGLTAARVSQILVQMHDENLITYDDVHHGGPGRPRRRYRWVTDSDRRSVSETHHDGDSTQTP